MFGTIKVNNQNLKKWVMYCTLALGGVYMIYKFINKRNSLTQKSAKCKKKTQFLDDIGEWK